MSTSVDASELLLRWQELRQQGQQVSAEELCAACPELAEELHRQIQALESMERLLNLDPADAAPGGAPDKADRGSPTPTEPAGNGNGRGATDRLRVPGYEILAVLDQGGMGIVYKARQVPLNRLVALKVIAAGPHANPQQLARFRAEAEAIARLKHPNIVQIHEVGEADGWPFFAMELVEGGSLAEELASAPLPAPQAAQLLETLAEAIHVAHQQGILHRDLKPGNILLVGRPSALGHRSEPTAESRWPRAVKITDFGLAKRVGGETQTAPGCRTQTGAVLGTPSYMAPEQAEGKIREFGPAVDVYALGAILYEMLTGRPPFRGETTLDTLEQVRSQEPVPPSRWQLKTPRDLETICLKCLGKEPSQRYASAQALADDLRRFLAGQPILARPTSVRERGVKWAKRQPALAALTLVSAAAVVCLLAGGIWFTVQLRAERDQAQHERDEAERQRVRAEAILRRALATVDEQAWSAVHIKGEMPKERVPGGILYNLAGVYALVSESTRQDTSLSEEDRRQLAERFAARAVELLANSRTAGYFEVPVHCERVKDDKELSCLWQRPDFRKLLAELEQRSTTGNQP